MLQKWKHIINNWINCYFDEKHSDKQHIVNIETLVNIISHLRENLNLDESKSSVLEARTVEQFILEKHQCFKFANGTAVASGEDDIYLAASLLLFFVCVNSKDVDIKSAMCSKLSGEDQEVIMKFSKTLMEYPTVTFKDVQAAIIEACGQDVVAKDTRHGSVAETPPALRSLHGEVRRLQAALDAEQFDRNYLQEELSRTNLRVEKLVKDKERYKLEIMNLTAKISMSCGAEHDSQGTDAGAEEAARLKRQLAETEEHLVRSQELLDDATYDRDELKRKIEDLKQDRDKWISLHQEESTRAAQLTEELETERRQFNSLKELVTELRQHNRLNGLDSSQLECDDPDASIPSLPHNLSICSEACANIIEVQLSEERAKVEALRQHIVTLQKENEQLHFSKEEDNSNHEVILKEKDCIIDKLDIQLKTQITLLESLRKDHETVSLSLANLNLETNERLKSKDEEIRQLGKSYKLIQMQCAELENVRAVMTNKVDGLVKEIKDMETRTKTEQNKYEKLLDQAKVKYDKLENEKDKLSKQLDEQNAAYELLKEENNYQQESCKLLVIEKNKLICDTAMLTQQLEEEKSLKQTLKEQHNTLSTQTETLEKTLSNQVKNVKKKLSKEVAKTNTLLREKESLEKALKEEKSARILEEQVHKDIMTEKYLLELNFTEIEKTKKELSEQLSVLTEKTGALEKQILDQKAVNEALNEEKLRNLTEYESYKTILVEQKESIIMEIESLQHELLAQKTLKEELDRDKNIVLLEKEQLKKSLEQKKLALIDIRSERDQLVGKVGQLNEQYDFQAQLHQAKLDEIEENVKVLRKKIEASEACANIMEVQLSEERAKVEALRQQIVTLQKENEQLHFSIEEDNSNHEVMLKEKDCIIDKLDIQLKTQITLLESLRKDHETVCLSLANLKLETNERLESKGEEIRQLGKSYKLLQMQCAELENVRAVMTNKVDGLVKEIKEMETRTKTEQNKYEKLLDQAKVKYDKLENEKDKLSKQLDEQNAAYELLKEENNHQQESCKLLVIEKNKLICDIAMLTQQLEEEKSLKQTLKEQHNTLSTQTETLEKTLSNQVKNVKKKLSKEVAKTNTLFQEKESLEKALKEEKSARILAEQVHKDIMTEKYLLELNFTEIEKTKKELSEQLCVLTEKTGALEKQLLDQKAVNEALNEEKLRNLTEYESYKTILVEQKESIVMEIESLQHELFAQKTLKEELDRYKNIVLLEKEQLKKSLEQKTLALIDIRSERDQLVGKVGQLNEQYDFQAQLHQAKLEEIEENVKVLRKKIEEHEELNKQISTMLSLGLDKLIKELKNEVIRNEVLHKLINADAGDSCTNKCSQLLNITNMLTIEVAIRDKLEKALELEKQTQQELKANLQLKENQIHELETNIEGLKATILINNVIESLEQTIKDEQKKYTTLREEKVALVHKCDILQEYHDKAEKVLDERQKEIVSLQKELQTVSIKVEMYEEESRAKDRLISKMSTDKDAVIKDVKEELVNEKELREQCQKELEDKMAIVCELKQNLNDMNNEREALNILKTENAELIKAVGYTNTFGVRSQENTSGPKYSGQLAERELRDLQHQVDNTSDLTHSSMDSLKTISDLEKIITDKNRTITTLNSEISYLKTLLAESENKLLDVTKEFEISKETCDQLSIQLKKIVHQKNEEIAEHRKQLSKMSVTENRATQIIKVSAKYQAIILKRIAEIKSNTVLKELTNFGNSNNGENELRRSLTAGSITMEDLENFLETTERHLKKCTDRQLTLQRDRDRLSEVNRINEAENTNMKEFLMELSESFQTFSGVKDTYVTKLAGVVAQQRAVRRSLLALEGRRPAAALLALERDYGAAAQDLAEAALALQRWAERGAARLLAHSRLQLAAAPAARRAPPAPPAPPAPHAPLDAQLYALAAALQRLQAAAAAPDPAPPAPDTLAEVRAEYEDKLDRMKSKMKQLYTEQIGAFKEKQKAETAALERALAQARAQLAQSARAYELHIRGLTSELWSVGEKFLSQQDAAAALRRQKRAGSLASLQHVHSSGIEPVEDLGRPSDTYSLRSLPVQNNGTKREGRGMHMSDEEGEVFDNRWLAELASPELRLSELRWRNSLCPPHLKSSYPAETHFAPVADEDEIKAMGAASLRQQRKEVGIIAYKKPGPPTPSKQAGRLSATDSELRESLRVEAEPQPSRKTSTPSRIRSLFRSSKTENNEVTPRRRLSSIFRKK